MRAFTGQLEQRRQSYKPEHIILSNYILTLLILLGKEDLTVKMAGTEMEMKMEMVTEIAMEIGTVMGMETAMAMAMAMEMNTCTVK